MLALSEALRAVGLRFRSRSIRAWASLVAAAFVASLSSHPPPHRTPASSDRAMPWSPASPARRGARASGRRSLRHCHDQPRRPVGRGHRPEQPRSPGPALRALKTFAVSAAQVGQVFGVALDNAPQPNIYLAATSAYGLSIYLPDRTQDVRRIRVGTPGAQFVPGQFGPAGLWRHARLDLARSTGRPAKPTSLPTSTPPRSAPPRSAGSPSIRPRSRSSPPIGAPASSTASASTASSAGPTTTASRAVRPAGLAPLPYIPGSPVRHQRAGLRAPSRRRPGASRRRRGGSSPSRSRAARLFYSVAQGRRSGRSASARTARSPASPRLEVEVPALQDGDRDRLDRLRRPGRMYLAERGPSPATIS